MPRDVVRTVTVSSITSTIEEAFAFVIEALDGEAMIDPSIQIEPFWEVEEGDVELDDVVAQYEVTVSGVVHRKVSHTSSGLAR